MYHAMATSVVTKKGQFKTSVRARLTKVDRSNTLVFYNVDMSSNTGCIALKVCEIRIYHIQPVLKPKIP